MKNKSLLIPVLVLVLGIHGCASNPMLVIPTINPSSTGLIQPTLETIPTASPPPGTSQNNPIPVGSDVIADSMRFAIKGAIRPADGIVSSGDMFNAQPGAYQQFIFVTLTVACETPSDQQCHLSIFKMKLSGSDSLVKYPERLISGVDGILMSTDFNGGTTISGHIPFIIPIGASHLELVYESLSEISYYLALP
jgi:hypothetical protein